LSDEQLRYAHLSPGRLREAVASLDDFSTPAAHEAAQQAASPVSSRQT